MKMHTAVEYCKIPTYLTGNFEELPDLLPERKNYSDTTGK